MFCNIFRCPQEYKASKTYTHECRYTRRPDERKVIKLNYELEAIADDDKVLSEFTNFLGTLARQSVPLDCISWHKFPEQQKEEL